MLNILVSNNFHKIVNKMKNKGGGLEGNWGFDNYEHLKLDVFDHM